MGHHHHHHSKLSALSRACATGNYAEAKSLLDSGAAKADPEAMLHAISGSGDTAVKCRLVELLLSKGASPNAKSIDEHSPLEAAIFSGSVDLIKLLTRKGARVDHLRHGPDWLLFSFPFEKACERGDVELIETLLDLGPRVTENQRLWISPGLLKIVPAAYDDETKTRLIRLLVSNGADVNYGSGRHTPLNLACGFCAEPNPQLVRVLIECGARTDLALNTACAADSVDRCHDAKERARFESNVVECVKILIKGGADANATDSLGRTPLHLACGQNNKIPNPQLVRLLLKTGGAMADAALPVSGRTALHVLCAANYDSLFLPGCVDEEGRASFNANVLECVRVLIKHGEANVNLADAEGNLPVTLAKNTGKREVVKLLQPAQQTRACWFPWAPRSRDD